MDVKNKMFSAIIESGIVYFISFCPKEAVYEIREIFGSSSGIALVA